VHEEHVGGLTAFRQIVVDREPTYIAESFLMLGVDASDECDCLADLPHPECSAELRGLSDALESFHANHLKFNTYVWCMLRGSGKMGAVRRVLYNDMRREEPYIIGDKKYGQRLLDYFLKASPHTKWVDLLAIVPEELHGKK
jgi:hypothetical protein